MPYTPPSPSPNASHSQSRTSSRSSSFSEIPSPSAAINLITPAKPQPTRSTSYLNKTRRSSLGGPRPGDAKPAHFMMSPPGGSGPILHPPRSTSGSSIRQAPPVPIMSTGVVISPPDSSQNSSDDEAENNRIKRGRQLVDVKELEAAIRNSIPQRRSASPVMEPKPEQVFIEQRSPEILSARIHQKLAHVVGHARSASDVTGSGRVPTIRQPEEPKRSQSQNGSPNMDDDEDDDAYRTAPPMVRKKSGELVKSSLKSPNLRRRPSSMPSTPTYPKVVHFDAHLEHVRHFLHSERPTAVSAGSSPVESGIDTDNEYPFPSSDEPPFEWEIATPNFPDRSDRSSAVVRVEKVLLSHDKKSLLGHVAVANISFQKLVVARFTLDYWQTTSEVAAEFTNDIRRRHLEDGYDRFTFKIKLEDMANLENKTLFFCVRYRCNDQEFWDNNNSINYQVDFKKKAIPQHGKSGASSASSRPLPRSRGVTSSAPRPRSMPIFDDSFDAYDLKTQPEYKMFSHAVDRQMDMRPAKPVKKTSAVDPEALARRANPSGNAFGNRYDFGASLAAAMATATTVLGPERSGLKLKTNLKEEKPAPNPYFHSLTANSGLPRSHSSPALSATFTTASDKQIPRVTLDTTTPAATPVPTPTFKPTSLDALKSLGSDRKPSVESASYKEILENFCFFGSAKSSPSLTTGSSMPNRPEGPGHENHSLAATNYKMSSRSPSPPHQGLDGASGRNFTTSPSTSSSSQGSQKGSRSPSPSHIYGFPATTPFDIRAPIIQT
ncbi:hypothetical protein EYR41_006175 [Orbilia oligospora]|uniref:CBM21 domain-containing protein n=1 Tax=Orbilia oligospora TaxID=2813651 RepID=A0A8H2E4A5_ORBOL|nr:hypothetical protein TWF217_006780 [Orbilia oligospora]KAF3255957.1 hypothetical protein TWF128_005413 [Orbilia oligospora]KAF3274341.1 hypothetical protein TWF132_003748 [Orbilia oligospora]TGJ70197.1 hypothetical protein EYR41_006175 [Orbilia oligospora]